MDKEIKAILGVVGGIIVTVGGVVLHMLMGPRKEIVKNG